MDSADSVTMSTKKHTFTVNYKKVYSRKTVVNLKRKAD